MNPPRRYRKTLRKVRRKVLAVANRGRSGGNGAVAQGWESYARAAAREEGNLGDEWNDPVKMGLDVERGADVVPYLDRTVIEPFLGTCDVMLEIGPGAGRFTAVLLPRCKTLIAVDTSKTMLELLRERFAGDSRLDARLGDGRGLGGVPDASVDAAFSYGVFVHLQHWDIFQYLSELRRVLKPGGKAIVQHSNTFSDLGWAKFMREVPRQLNKNKLSYTFIANTPELMRELSTRAGLECVEMNTEIAKRDCIAFLRKPGRA
jgi:ubiquinone/menaquinone biosynthesis C-methylase UbiE